MRPGYALDDRPCLVSLDGGGDRFWMGWTLVPGLPVSGLVVTWGLGASHRLRTIQCGNVRSHQATTPADSNDPDLGNQCDITTTLSSNS